MRIEHLAIWADDIELLRQFYMKYFDMTCGNKYINSSKNYTSYFLSFGKNRTRIELMHIPELSQNSVGRNMMKGLAHFAISVGRKEVVNSLTEQLRKDGLTIASEPRTTGDEYYESAILDPEGNYIEITE